MADFFRNHTFVKQHVKAIKDATRNYCFYKLIKGTAHQKSKIRRVVLTYVTAIYPTAFPSNATVVQHHLLNVKAEAELPQLR